MDGAGFRACVSERSVTGSRLSCGVDQSLSMQVVGRYAGVICSELRFLNLLTGMMTLSLSVRVLTARSGHNRKHGCGTNCTSTACLIITVANYLYLRCFDNAIYCA